MLYQRGKTYWMRHKVGGLFERVSTGSTNHKLAKEIDENRTVQIARGIHNIRKGDDLTFSEFSAEYLNRWTEQTKKSLKNDLKTLRVLKPFFGHTKLSAITTVMIEDYRLKRLKSPKQRQSKMVDGRKRTLEDKPATVKKSSINREVALLKSIFSKAYLWGRVDVNPCLKIKQYPEPLGPARFLSCEELEKFYKLISHNKRLLDMVGIYVNTGMRKDEVRFLQWPKVNLSRNQITLPSPKNGKPVVVEMNEEVKRILLARSVNKENPMWVFPRKDGLGPYDFRTAFETARRRCAFSEHWTLHTLRHTFASYLVMRGVDLSTVSAMLNHSTMTMTARYVHLSQKHKIDALATLQNVPSVNCAQLAKN